MNELSLVVYQAHPVTGEYIGSVYADPDPLTSDCWIVPAMAFTEAPPVVGEGFTVVHIAGSDSAWSVVADLRGDVYHTDTGEKVQWQQLGELPEGVTSKPWPGPGYVWKNDKWVLDEAQHTFALADIERRWRDSEIDNVKWLRERHRDETDLNLDAATLTEQQFSQLLEYLQALRNWPQGSKFPVSEFRPVRPDWIVGLVQ